MLDIYKVEKKPVLQPFETLYEGIWINTVIIRMATADLPGRTLLRSMYWKTTVCNAFKELKDSIWLIYLICYPTEKFDLYPSFLKFF